MSLPRCLTIKAGIILLQNTQQHLRKFSRLRRQQQKKKTEKTLFPLHDNVDRKESNIIILKVK